MTPAGRSPGRCLRSLRKCIYVPIASRVRIFSWSCEALPPAGRPPGRCWRATCRSAKQPGARAIYLSINQSTISVSRSQRRQVSGALLAGNLQISNVTKSSTSSSQQISKPAGVRGAAGGQPASGPDLLGHLPRRRPPRRRRRRRRPPDRPTALVAPPPPPLLSSPPPSHFPPLPPPCSWA